MTMAVTLQCPRCTHEQTIDDDRANGEVPCKICHHLISAKPLTKKAPPKAVPKKANSNSDVGFQTGAPPAKSGKPPAVGKPKPSKKRRDDDDDDEDDERPAPRRKSSGSDSGTMMYVFLAGGGLLLLALLCGGGGVAAWMLSPDPGRPAPIAEAPPIVPNPIQVPNPNPNPFPIPVKPFPDPFPNNPNPFPIPVPMPRPLDPNNPADLDRAFTELQGPAHMRGQALQWFSAANTNHPRAAEIRKRLDSLVDENLQQPFGNDAFFNAYFRWANKDSVPALLRIVENNRFGPSDRRNRHEAMRLLGRFKEASAVPVIAKRLTDHFDRGVVIDVLTEMGPAAEGAMLKTFNHPDNGARDAIRRIVQNYKTPTDKIVVQCIADLDSPDNNSRTAALQYLVKNPVEPARKADMAKALNKLMVPDNCLQNRDLVVALEAWATTENTPRLMELVDKNPFTGRDAIRILAKIGDPKSVKGIAHHIGSPGFVGMEARNALKTFGPAGEAAVIEVLNTTNDARTRGECVRCLGEIGTRGTSIPALLAMAMRLPQDQLFMVQVRSAVTQIEFRAKMKG